MTRSVLRILGGAVLEQDDRPVSGPGSRRHPIALLALLALAPSQTASRAKLLGYLWPSTDEATGRNRLTSVVYSLRKLLGSTCIVSTGDSLRLDRSGLACDVLQFMDAVERGDDDSASELYGGPLLDGFYLEGAPEFEQRVASQRSSLHATWRDVIERLALTAAQRAEHRKAASLWQKLYTDDPLDTSIAERLVAALSLSGHRGEAERVVEVHARHMAEELGIEAVIDVEAAIEATDSIRSAFERKAPAGSIEPMPSIAVLPFDLTAGDGGRSLAEGLHSGILTRLSSLDGLSTIARSSVRRYRGTEKSASEIAAELAVQYVLEGELQESSKQFRIDVRLVDAPSDRQIWAADYQGHLNADTFFQAQAEIAGAVVERLCGELSLEARERLGRRPTDSLEAFRLCALGRDLLDQRSERDMRSSLEYFEHALEHDAGYALAWVGLADALGLLHSYGYVDASVLPRAEQAIHRALDSDSQSAEAHAAFGRLLGQRNLALEAEREIRLALTLKPGYAEAHSWLTIGLHVRGAAEESVASALRAVTLNPLSIEANGNLVSSYLFAGRLDDALREARQVRRRHPDYETAALLEGLTLYEMDEFDEAVVVLDRLEVPWTGVGAKTAHSIALIAAGRETEAKSLLEEIRSASRPFDEGLVLAAFGEIEAAFRAFAGAKLGGLDFAFSYWPTVCVRYLFENVWQPLRSDPRYAALCNRIDACWGLAADEG